MNPCHTLSIPPEGELNCGRCEKCVRTMLALQAMGKLESVTAFHEDQVPASRLFRMPVNNLRKAKMLSDQLPLLKQAGLWKLVWALRLRLLLFRLLRH